MSAKNEKAVKAIILNSGGNMLVLEQIVEGEKYYSLPGGRVQTSGDEIEELKREVKEETGLEMSGFEYVGQYSFERRNGTITVCNAYKVTNFNGEISSEGKESYEDIHIHWMDPKEFADRYARNESLSKLINDKIVK